MNRTEWLANAKANRVVLRQLLAAYHPANRLPGRRLGDYITAPNAEIACANVRKEIRDSFVGDPCSQFDAAVDAGNIGAVYTLLNSAWFGVPENTNCWRIPGFTEAVALLEDMPDDDDED